MPPPTDPARAAGRAADLLAARRTALARRTDRWLAGVLLAQCAAGAVAFGPASTAIQVGAAVVAPPILLAALSPGRAFTRHALAVAQMLLGSLYIHLSDGRAEAYFHLFASLAVLALYRDWTVLATAVTVALADDGLRHLGWPSSVYGSAAAAGRWPERAGWLLAEGLALALVCVGAIRDMRHSTRRQAELEAAMAADGPGQLLATPTPGENPLDQPTPPAAAPTPDVLDAAALWRSVYGDHRLLHKLQLMFATDAPTMLAEIRSALDAGDAGRLRAATHQLKGTIGALSAPEALAAARQLDALALGGDLTAAANASLTLEAAVRQLQAALEAEVQRQSRAD